MYVPARDSQAREVRIEATSAGKGILGRRLRSIVTVVALVVSAIAWGGGIAAARDDVPDAGTGAVYVLTNDPMHNQVVVKMGRSSC